MTALELRLLGGATLLDGEQRPVGGRATHRHRMALLAILALAHPAGVTRAKLVGLLWPERDESSARNLLRVALSELRRALGAAALPGSDTELRLDPRAILVDVHRFEELLAAGDAERAVALYRGPLLDGFFLDDAEAFDAWVSAERRRLADRHVQALETLALSAGAAGRPDVAARWWTALAAARPGDGRVALAAVDALAAAGDAGGALAQAAAHAEHLREEHGVAPAPELAERVATLRRAPTAPTPVDVPDPEPAAPVAAPIAAPVAAPAAAAVVAVDRAPAVEPTARPSRARSWRAFAAAAAVVLATAALWTAHARRAAGAAPDVVAVAPFQVLAGAPRELRAGVADLLTTNLDQVAGIRTVPARIAARRAASLGADAEPAELARAIRGSVVTGTVTATGDGVRVRAALVDGEGRVLARAEARGAALAAVVDTLSAGLLRELWGRRAGVPAPRLAAVSTTDAEAMRAFVRGEALLRAAAWDSAAAALAEAVERDSTFALAHLRRAEAEGWRSSMGTAAAERALAAARRWASRLPPRERTILAVRELHEAGDLAAVDSAEALAGRYPDDPDALYLRADTRFHARHYFTQSDLRRTMEAFDVAAAADPASARVLAHPYTLALEAGDRARFDAVAARLEALEPDAGARRALHETHALVRAVRWSPPARAAAAFLAAVRADAAGAARLAELKPALERACLLAPEPAPDILLAAYDSARAAYPEGSDARRAIDGTLMRMLVGLGRVARARPMLATFDAPGYVALPVALGYAPRGFAEPFLRRLDADPRWSTPERRRQGRYWRAIAALAAGDAAAGRAALRAATAPGPAPGDTAPTLLRTAARAAEGWARLVDGDSAAALRTLATELPRLGYAEEALGLGGVLRVVHARLEATRPELLDLSVDRLRYAAESWDGHFVAWWRRELAGALAAAGDRAGAAEERRRFERLWAGADPAARAAAR